MYVRLAFSVAAHLEPEILLVDEVLAVGDAEFQQRCLGRMEDFSGTGRTVVFVSHNMQTINQLCDRVDLARRRRGSRRTAIRREVVTHYLHSRPSGSGSRISWPDDEIGARRRSRAPSVRPRDRRGRRTRSRRSTCAEPIGIEMRYRVLRTGPGVFAKIRVHDRRRRHRFQRDGHRRRMRRSPSEPGVYTATAWIPGEPPERGDDDRRRRRLHAARAEAAPARRAVRGGARSTSSIPATATAPAGASPAS